MTTVRTATIIGGGIAGPATAIALQKAGIESTVYEAYATGADRAGAFMTVGSNGIAALRVLDASDRVVDAGFATPSINLRSYTGKSLGFARIDASEDGSTPSHTLKRSVLYRAIRDEAIERGIRIEYDKRLVEAVDETDDVRAVFADGSTAVADVLIGCDGVHSTVRRLIDPKAPAPAYAGLIGTGGYTRDLTVDTEPGAYEMIFGKRAFLGYVSAPDGEVWWFANVPCTRELSREELASTNWRARLLEAFQGDQGPMCELITATPGEIQATNTYEIERVPQWQRGRMVILGDAAHAASPAGGQGASMAAEDAVVLAKCMRDHTDVQAALEAFVALRRPRVERVVAESKRYANMKLVGPVGRFFRDLMLPWLFKRQARPDNTESRAWLFDHRIEWNA